MKTIFGSISKKMEENKNGKNRHDWCDECTVSTMMMKSHDHSGISRAITKNIMIVSDFEGFF